MIASFSHSRLGHPHIVGPACLLKILDELLLIVIPAYVEQPHASDKSILPARAPSQQIFSFHPAPAIGGSYGFDRVYARKLLGHPVGVVVLDDVREAAKAMRRCLDE